MNVKDYTCLKINKKTIFKRRGFIPYHKIFNYPLKGKIEIEYYTVVENKKHSLALLFLRGDHVIGAVYPYGYYQNSSLQL